jgi:hypothetical protein
MVKTWWWMRGEVVARKNGSKSSFVTYLVLATWRIITRQLAGQTDEYNGSVWCWIGGIRLAVQPKAHSRVLQMKNKNPNQQQDSTTMNTNSTRLLKNGNCGSKSYRTAKNYISFLAFSVELGTKAKNNYKA